jgi:uncharacterized membrane protein YjfL (UPF0719 family)
MNELFWALYSGGYLLLAVLLLLLAKKVFDLATPFVLDVHLTEKDNPAIGILLAGYLLGVAAIICATFSGEGALVPSFSAFIDEAGAIVVYALIGMLCLFVAGILNDKIMLRKFSNHHEIVENRNTAVATVMATTYVGSGLIIAGGIHGSLSIVTALTAFVVGQVLLLAFGGLYQLATRYDNQKELGTHDNLAAGIAIGGNLLAFSLILMKALFFDVHNIEVWDGLDRLLHVLYYTIAGCVLLGVTRIINDRLFLPGASLSKEIADDRNVSAGLIEGGLALAMGCILVFCL